MTAQIQNLLDLKYMKPLLLLANILGQYQPNNIHENYKPVLWYKCYAGVVSLAIVGAYVEMQYEEEFRRGIFKNTTAVVMNFMSITIFTVATVYAILENVFVGPSKLHAALRKFLKVDKLLMQIENSKIVENKDFSIKIIMQHVIIFTIMAFNIIWFEVLGGKRIMKITYLQVFEQYASFVAFLIITNCFLELRNRYKSLNLSLVAIFDEEELDKPNPMRVSKYLETLTVAYGILTEVVDLFNDLFGWQILVIFIYTLIGLLASLNIIALFIPKYFEITEHYDVNGGFFIAVVLDFTLFSIVRQTVNHHNFGRKSKCIKSLIFLCCR